jgi:hypothetical protein
MYRKAKGLGNVGEVLVGDKKSPPASLQKGRGEAKKKSTNHIL